MRSILSLISMIVLFGCSSPEPDNSSIYEVKNIGVLSTSEYTVGKIIQLDDKADWWKFGDRKILISCKAKIKAGINLLELKDENIIVEGNKITIQLPPVQITSFEIDPNTVNTEVEDINGFRMRFNQEEKNKILRLGERSIREKIEETGILKEAERNAVLFIQEFYKQLGYEEVQVIISKPGKE